MVTGRNGVRREPNEATAIIAGVAGVIFGIWWTVVAAAAFSAMAIFGLVFVVVGIFATITLSIRRRIITRRRINTAADAATSYERNLSETSDADPCRFACRNVRHSGQRAG